MYEIRNKVIAITTDGASNFKCALKRHGNDYETFDQMITSITEEDDELFHIDMDDLNSMWCPANELLNDSTDNVMPLEVNIDESESDTTELDENFQTESLPDDIIQKVIDNRNVDFAAMLPSRVDCSAHNFNLVGKVDSFKALDDKLYAARYISVFKKLNAIWKMNSTRRGRETFDHYLQNHKIHKPHRIRWNRIYYAVSFLPILQFEFFFSHNRNVHKLTMI